MIRWFFALLLAAPLTAGINKPVSVDGGLISGVPGADPSVTVFRGVPFAAPPVDMLRWRAPQPVGRWDGVRSGARFGANCVQEMHVSFGPWTSEYQPQGAVSEDCLYLNVWTAAASPAGKRPVLVYVPGGAFTGGSGNVPVYDGEGLAKKGIVVVTINYRVGVLGFFVHPELTKESGHESSGNYGLLDQLAALQWVKKNIASFGGDPGRVTVAGQSAGAASVHYLTASPLAKGLFIRAIANSGSGVGQGPRQTRERAEQNGLKFAECKGAKSLHELRTMPAEAVVKPVNGAPSFGPVVDGWFLPAPVDAVFADGKQNDVPTLTGWTYDEGSFNASYGKQTAEEYEKQVRQRAGALTEEVLKLYPVNAQKDVARDTSLVSTYLWAAARARTGKTKVFTYLFDHMEPGPDKDKYLVFHSSELPYVFDSLGKADRPWTSEDRKIAELMSAYWVNFVKTGDPNGKGLPHWPAFTEASATTMELGDRNASRPIAEPGKMELLKRTLTVRGR